jgi:predicted amidohydrolase
MKTKSCRRGNAAAIVALSIVAGAVIAFDAHAAEPTANAQPAKIAAISVASLDGMVAENYARAFRLGRIALDSKPDIVLFPEAFAAGYCGTNLAPYAESLDSDYQRQFLELSRDGNCLVAVGFLEKVPKGVRNTVAVYDRGERLGTHSKKSLWADKDRPYRDEPSLMVPGETIEVFSTRFGRMAVLICYENVIAANWDEIAPKADFVLSPYNCESDPSHDNVKNARRLNLPSAWADRTGTVYAGPRSYRPNLGTAGMVSSTGAVVATSVSGVEAIVIGELSIMRRQK